MIDKLNLFASTILCWLPFILFSSLLSMNCFMLILLNRNILIIKVNNFMITQFENLLKNPRKVTPQNNNRKV